jgi:hypothetical protein
MKYLLIAIGAAIAYKCFAEIVRRNDRDDLYEDARRNRQRVLNQQGELPGTIYWS